MRWTFILGLFALSACETGPVAPDTPEQAAWRASTIAMLQQQQAASAAQQAAMRPAPSRTAYCDPDGNGGFYCWGM